MNLPFFTKKKPPIRKEYLYSLEINHEVVKSAIWGIYNEKSQVLSVGSNAVWDGSSSESLVQACDQSLSDAATRLDPSGKTQPDKVVLGLPPDWISAEKIVSNRMALLKNLSQSLSLSIVGYVVTPDAMVRFLQHQEGVPPTAILIGVWPHQIEITLVRLGKPDIPQLVTRSPKILDDVIEGLSRYSHVDMLPSRMLLYDSGLDLEEVKQNLLSHPWQSPQTRLPFLHFPKIEVLPSDFTIRAISLAAGLEVAQSIGIVAVPEAVPTPPPPPATPEDLGFFSDPQSAENPVIPATPAVETLPIEAPTQPALNPKPPKIPKISLPKISLNFSRWALLIVPLLIISAAVAGYWYLPQATVTLVVTPKSLEHKFTILADTKAQTVDSDKNLIPASQIETTASSKKSAATTGTQLIGDKASGKVTVINGTASVRNFPAGTILTSPSGLKFTTDSSVSIASASGTADPNSYVPGRSDVAVTASQIGTDSNLSAGTQFRIGTFSALDYVAKNTEAISGGSSRQAPSVSKNDIAKLRSDLMASLNEEVKNKLLAGIPGDSGLLDGSIQTKVVSEKFSNTEGAVADQLDLDLSVQAKALTLKKSDIKSLISGQIKSLIPDGYSQKSQPEFQYTMKNTTNNQANVEVNLSAPLLPVFNLDQIQNNLPGKKPAQARDYLLTLPGVSRVDIVFSLPLPSKILTLPHIRKNIHLEIVSQ